MESERQINEDVDESKGNVVDEIAGIIGFILLGLTWFALRGMRNGSPRSRSRR